MTATTPARPRLHWKSPWLIAAIAAFVAIVASAGVGLGTGLLRFGNRPGPSLASSPSPVSSPSGGASPSASPTPTPFELSCRLPVVVPYQQGEPPGGWVSFPAGTFTRDPASLSGGIQSWDAAIQRWVPVAWKALSPDGLHYASIDDAANTIHVTDAVNRADRAFALPVVHGAWSVVDYTDGGIYLNAFQGEQGELGLWLVTPGSGNVTRLDNRWNWTEVGDGAAWGVAYDAHGMALKRLDRNTRTMAGLLYPPDATQTLSLLALDRKGRAVVALSKPSGNLTAIMLVDQNGRTVSVDLPSRWTTNAVAVGKGFQMSSGVWLTGTGFGLALLTPGGSLVELTKQPEVFAVSGGCH